MFAWQFAKAQARGAPTPFVSMQNHYNLVYREEEREMIPQCIDQGVGVIPWSPLARGLLAGNRTRCGEKLTDARPDRRLRATPSTRPSSTSTSSSRAARSPPRAASPPPGRAGLAAAQARRDRADRRAPPSSSTSRTRWRPSSCRSATRRSRGWRSPTCPTPDFRHRAVRSTATRATVGRRCLKATISAAPSIDPASRGTTASSLSRAQNAMSSSSPGGP